jgi:sigma-B regulation protein RsbU (phosphoserine phosphatase)
VLPVLTGSQLAARWEPASAFGGDCYDVIRLSDTRFAICIADVCGKGLPAALLMANLQASVRAFASSDSAPRRIATSVNASLVRNTGLSRFVTFFYAVYDTVTRELTFSNAGHNPPIVISASGAVKRLSTGGMVLGVFGGAEFDEDRIALASGDRLLLFTDGIVEAANASGDEYGDARLTSALARRRTHSACALVNVIFDDVSQFADRPLQDDATVVALAVE